LDQFFSHNQRVFFSSGPGGDLGAAHRVYGLAELRGQVVAVEGHRRVRQMPPDPGDERRAHVRAGGVHLLRVAAVCGQVGGELLDRVGVATLGGEAHPPDIQIGEQG
jgi:hypothetical protein